MNIRLLFFLIFICTNTLFSQTLKNKKSGTVNNNTAAVTIPDYIKILWLDENNALQLNENYLKNATDQQRAALGYIATSVGSECYWDGDKKADESNLKCKLLSALNLGYQCSEKHLSFLKEWFKGDQKVIESLQYCNKTEAAAKTQDRFIALKMATSKNSITIIYTAMGVDLNQGSNWKWTEKSTYSFSETEIKQTDRENIQGSFY
ncbi:hypothetical protein IRZ83_04400 [Flavobacterium sp. JLP]|uniref:hypothetical protein n=1 Tax=unclassified Flavobacterium TaxID=196869 RepID=UPI00188BC9D7|nr:MULTISPECIES: hypothetical protein [unclassified Flavobacterium]MBF4491871.1 hypothetical protein [Flavobacterium sp. MR2016-29]MBF4505898.1 hypothetical protein [Flavobacterium sp. JLP]